MQLTVSQSKHISLNCLPWETTPFKLPVIHPSISCRVLACSAGKNTGGVFPMDARVFLVTGSLDIA